MKKVGKIPFKAIKRISPSQFCSMKNCAYKALLAEAFDKHSLLPVSANAYFGTVLHKMLELISKRLVKTDDEFNLEFSRQLKTVEDDVQVKGYGSLTPFQKNVKDYGIKIILLKKHLSQVRNESRPDSKLIVQSEKWVESSDKVMAGKIDLVVEKDGEVELVDFKTGSIVENALDDSGEIFSEVKEEYRDQLKLYAYLYFENTGTFPTLLSVVDLAKQKYSIDFSEAECKALFQEATQLLTATNETVKTGLYSANPNEKNCKYCLYRPACLFFLKTLESIHPYNDVSGLVKSVVKYQNGNVNITIGIDDKTLTVRSFPPEAFDGLLLHKGKRINIFNLRKEATDLVYSVTKTTALYEEES